MDRDKKIAIIDLGSNSVRMILVAIQPNGAYKMIDQVKSMVRLSKGMTGDQEISPEGLKKTLTTLKIFQKFIVSYKADLTIPVATAALRVAKNRGDILKTIERETGLCFRILSGHEEAYYGYLGVINSIDVSDFYMIDIGGGSVEIAKVINRKVENSVSLPLGAVTLTERFSLEDQPKKKHLASAENLLIKEFQNLPWLDKTPGLPVVGLGGTIRTLAKMDHKRFAFELESLHNYRFYRREAETIMDRVFREDYKGRSSLSGLSKDRADIILGGLLPLKTLLSYLEPDKLIISGNGLREGVFFEKYLTELFPQPLPVTSVLDHSLYNTLGRYWMNVEHAENIYRIARTLYEGLKEHHPFSDRDLPLLRTAGLLHDLGMSVDYYKHHNHTFYLILHSRIYGLTQKETILSAFIAGNHRDKKLKEIQLPYEDLLDSKEQKLVRIFGMFLKIAEMLDRNQYGSLTKVSTKITNGSFELHLSSKEAIGIESLSIEPFKEDFYDLFELELKVRCFSIQ